MKVQVLFCYYIENAMRLYLLKGMQNEFFAGSSLTENLSKTYDETYYEIGHLFLFKKSIQQILSWPSPLLLMQKLSDFLFLPTWHEKKLFCINFPPHISVERKS